MDELSTNILALQKISKQLEPSEANRDRYMAQLTAYSSSFINALDETPTYSDAAENTEAFRLGNEKMSFAKLLKIYASEVAAKGINAASGFDTRFS